MLGPAGPTSALGGPLVITGRELRPGDANWFCEAQSYAYVPSLCHQMPRRDSRPVGHVGACMAQSGVGMSLFPRTCRKRPMGPLRDALERGMIRWADDGTAPADKG